MNKNQLEGTPINQQSNFRDEEWDRNSWNNYQRKSISPVKRQRRYEDNTIENQGLTFAQAAYTATSNSVCPWCKQNLPQDRRNINLNYDKNLMVVPNGNRTGMMSPTTMNFPGNEAWDSKSPSTFMKTSQMEESKDNKKTKRKRK